MAVYRRWDDGFVIRRMRRGEEQLVIEWFGEIEPMSSDLQVAMAMRHGDDDDGSGFYAGELNGEMVASLVQTRIAHDLLYVSCVYVAAPHRRSGFAQRMISTAEDLGPQRHWTTAGSVVLDAYDHLRSMYQRFGYIAAFKVTTYHGTVSTNADRDGFRADIKEVGDAEFEQLMRYDDLCFVRPGSSWRRELMSRWVNIAGGRALIAVNQRAHVVGYGCRRPSVTADQHHFIGPLYADSYDVALQLVQQLTRDVVGQNVLITVMEPNEEAVRLVGETMTVNNTTSLTRMYHSDELTAPSQRVFAITCDTVCGF